MARTVIHLAVEGLDTVSQMQFLAAAFNMAVYKPALGTVSSNTGVACKVQTVKSAGKNATFRILSTGDFIGDEHSNLCDLFNTALSFDSGSLVVTASDITCMLDPASDDEVIADSDLVHFVRVRVTEADISAIEDSYPTPTKD
jgi:hypothetical protein